MLLVFFCIWWNVEMRGFCSLCHCLPLPLAPSHYGHWQRAVPFSLEWQCPSLLYCMRWHFSGDLCCRFSLSLPPPPSKAVATDRAQALCSPTSQVGFRVQRKQLSNFGQHWWGCDFCSIAPTAQLPIQCFPFNFPFPPPQAGDWIHSAVLTYYVAVCFPAALNLPCMSDPDLCCLPFLQGTIRHTW